MERLDFLEETYDDMLINSKVIDSGTESTIVLHDGKIYKILVPDSITISTKKRLRKINDCKDLEEYLTMPLREIYYEFRFIGYEMDYAGINLADYLIDNIKNSTLTNDMKYDLMLKLKRCIEKIHEHKMIHGDIQPRNVLVNDGHVVLGDINNMNFGVFKNAYLNEVSLRLCDRYGVSPIIDIHAFNYFCYLIFNAPDEILMEILQFGADSIFRTDLINVSNKYFDESVVSEQKDLFNNRNNKKLALMNSKYLIDYLK